MYILTLISNISTLCVCPLRVCLDWLDVCMCIAAYVCAIFLLLLVPRKLGIHVYRVASLRCALHCAQAKIKSEQYNIAVNGSWQERQIQSSPATNRPSQLRDRHDVVWKHISSSAQCVRVLLLRFVRSRHFPIVHSMNMDRKMCRFGCA